VPNMPLCGDLLTEAQCILAAVFREPRRFCAFF
jgi:hypothetical protein